MYGSSSGNCSMSLARRFRCTDCLTLVLEEPWKLCMGGRWRRSRGAGRRGELARGRVSIGGGEGNVGGEGGKGSEGREDSQLTLS